MNFEGVKKFVLNKLDKELKPELYYHSLDHTLDVLESVERLASMEKVNGTELQLLKTAALFHDLGFVVKYKGHEKESIKMAYEILPDYGYTKDEIEKIEGLILSTEIPQLPKNKLEMIMADADLDYIGRDDLFLIGQRLQYEWKVQGIISTIRDWHEKQLNFLKTHEYFTASAKKLRDAKKAENIKQLEELLCKKK
jgi:HD superfamily phosphodiesterase